MNTLKTEDVHQEKKRRGHTLCRPQAQGLRGEGWCHQLFCPRARQLLLEFSVPFVSLDPQRSDNMPQATMGRLLLTFRRAYNTICQRLG